MVTKRTQAPAVAADATQASNPPYPTTPTDWTEVFQSKEAHAGTSSQHAQIERKPVAQRRDSDVSSHGTWDTDDEEEKREEPVEVPQPLHITPGRQNLVEHPQQNMRDDLPAILKPGPAATLAPSAGNMNTLANQALANPWAEETSSISPDVTGRSSNSNNPYLRPKDNAASAWSGTQAGLTTIPIPPPLPQTAPPPLPPPSPPPPPVELPTASTPSDELAQLSLTPNRQSIQRKPIVQPSPKGGSTIAAIAAPAVDVSAGSWQSSPMSTAQHKSREERQHYAPPPGPPPGRNDDLIDFASTDNTPTTAPTTHAGLSPISTTHPPAPVANDAAPYSLRTTEAQRSEHYQIKHINWQDTASGPRSAAIRQSPILTQNANGPCPLLALVNALVLTTPDGVNTALIETLRTREQVSLGLLLDAVFDELMSGRRGDSASSLPDVSELYRFLLALHTGMNVNPRFVAAQASSHQAGTFEQTKEMRLYSTFDVPLIHGWVPLQGSVSQKAFARSAQSFEDAQNIQFNETELEDKLRSQGLTTQEQQALQDIQSIKHFLETWPTQLTDYGLQTITNTLRPGQVAILFRNDHFSTIYKEPVHGALMTLVTDAGYSSHDEIVWESLVDVNGAASELFSGDFRGVSHSADMRPNYQSSAEPDQGWQTVQGRNRTNHTQHTADSEVPPPLPGPRPHEQNTASTMQRSHSEQEDHDFALALQLQEEEDAQQRQQQDRQRREQQLSEQFLSSQNEGRPPAIPPRRGSNRVTTSIRPPVNRPTDHAFDPDAPPTYEQSASDRPYREGGSSNQSGALDAYDTLRRQQEQQSAYQSQAASSPTSSTFPGTHGRRTSYGNRLGRRQSQLAMPGGYDNRRPGQAATAQDADERCILM